MTGTLRTLRLMAVVGWLGGLLFFAFVEAPTAFHVLGTTEQFARLIGNSLSLLHRMGYTAGFVFLLASITLWFRTGPSARRLLLGEISLVVVMVVMTLYIQDNVVPAMERDRLASGGDIAVVAKSDPKRADFERLHKISERAEGAILILGLGVLVFMGFENSASPMRLPL